MSCPCTFEAKIQLECGLALAKIVRSGGLIEKRSEALEHIGCFTGSLGTYLRGNQAPEVFGAASPTSTPDTLAACSAEVERQLGGEGAQMSPLAILAIRKLVKLVLEQLL